MYGHHYGFRQLCSLEQDEHSFNFAFGRWLLNRFGVSVCSGWASALESLGRERQDSATELFVELVPKFLEDWTRSSGLDEDASIGSFRKS